MSKAEERALEVYPPKLVTYSDLFGEETLDDNGLKRTIFIEGYSQAEKDVAESFARIIRGNLGGIGNNIQNMFEQLYTEITGEKMYEGFKD